MFEYLFEYNCGKKDTQILKYVETNDILNGDSIGKSKSSVTWENMRTEPPQVI